jgi:hypothetical protein
MFQAPSGAEYAAPTGLEIRMGWVLQRFRPRRSLRTERGSVTRSDFDGLEAFGLSRWRGSRRRAAAHRAALRPQRGCSLQPSVGGLASAARTSQPWADGQNPVGILKTERRRRGIFVETANQKCFKLRRSGICRPDGAGEFGGAGGYKDFAPDGACGARVCDPQRLRCVKAVGFSVT